MNLLSRLFNENKKGKIVHPDIQKGVTQKEIKRPVNEIVADIHNEFSTASEILLKEAKQIINTPINDDALMAMSLGFNNAKGVREEIKRKEDAEKAKRLSELIFSYSVKLPDYKFITEDKVREICLKYSLVFTGADKYKGDIPSKNLLEIKAFTELEGVKSLPELFDVYLKGVETYRASAYITVPVEIDTIVVKGVPVERAMEYQQMYGGNNIKLIAHSPQFQICAPVSDVDTSNMRIENGYRLSEIPDPVVLYPVSGGYLVVTKWGIEGEDTGLINEKHN